ncbi:MAG: iron-containing alcohol dehydrogenase [Casimicrobiaceae bacterium]
MTDLELAAPDVASANDTRALPPGFEFRGLPTRVVLRAGAVDDLEAELRAVGIRKAMLVCGRRTAASPLGALVRRVQAIAAVVDDVVEHSDCAHVEVVARRAAEAGIDGLVAVGGGSASDTAKAIAIVLAEGAPLARHANVFTPPDHYVQQALAQPKLPIVVVPTTASAAEVTPGLGVRAANGRKLLFWDAKLAPRTILLDPLANVDVPVGVMASTGMNAVAHCIEGLYSRVRNPISDALALGGLRALHQAMPAMVRDPTSVTARADVLAGAHLSGMVIANARVGIHHGICHGLGSLGGLPHGIANAVLLPHAMGFNAAVAGPPLRRAAEAMGVAVADLSDAQAVQRAIDAVVALQRTLGVPTRLRDTGLDRGLFGALADLAMGDRGLYFNPRRATREDVLALLEAAW